MKRLIPLLLVIFAFTTGKAQNKNEFKQTFVEAESHYLYSEYEFANQLYLILYDQNSDNANLAYKIGNCYLHIPFEKSKAIPYLEQSVKNADYEAEEGSYKERRAPLDAYFELANAYRTNGELDKAIATYTKFKSLLTAKNKMLNSEFIDQEIAACNNARELIKNPKFFKKQNLGGKINVASINFRPVVSEDESTLVYTSKFGEDNVIYFSKKESGEWSPPVDITDLIGSNRDCESTCLNKDGTELYLYKRDEYVGNIYVSYYQNDHWSKIKKLNKNINTKYYESSASLSNDGKTLYFTSNRPGGIGQQDIYKSEKDKNGEWGPAINLGKTINTPYNETAPFITANDSLLFFSSEGHFNMGGFDNFKSQKSGNSWSTPENLGYPLNTTDNDQYYLPVKNGLIGYYSFIDGYKQKDIFRLFFTDSILTIKGVVYVADSLTTPLNKFLITVIDTALNDTVKLLTPMDSTGFYSFTIKPATYKFVYSGVRLLSHVEYFTPPADSGSFEFTINVKLEPYIKKKLSVEESGNRFSQIVPSEIPQVEQIDSSALITNVMITDPDTITHKTADFLYFTVQLMALLNPVDVTYFNDHGFENVQILHGEDQFYRYIYGQFTSLEEARTIRKEIIKMGYLDVFVKKVFKKTLEDNSMRKD